MSIEPGPDPVRAREAPVLSPKPTKVTTSALAKGGARFCGSGGLSRSRPTRDEEGRSRLRSAKTAYLDTRLLLAIEPCPLLFRVFAFVACRLHFDQEDPRRALLTSRILPPHLLGRLVFL
jgi:hypothetical protein